MDYQDVRTDTLLALARLSSTAVSAIQVFTDLLLITSTRTAYLLSQFTGQVRISRALNIIITLTFCFRYMPCTSLSYKSLTARRCSKWTIFQTFQTGVVVALSQSFMALCLYALSGRNNHILHGLSIYIAIQTISNLVLIILPHHGTIAA